MDPADTPDGSPLGAKLLHLDLPSDKPGVNAHRRISGQCCKPCANSPDHGNVLKYLRAGLTQNVLNNFSEKPPPYHVTQRLEVEKITRHQSVRGRGGVIVMYETRWTVFSRPSWDLEMGL